MATGARGRGNAGAAAPEKLQGLAEERFLAGDVAGALRVAREAKARCCTPLPSSLAHALAAYEVHNAAAASRSGGRDWYAILGFGGAGAITREDIKRRYRRLCIVLHPDKNRSVAADGAFKLLQEAWAALSAGHPPPPPSAEQKPEKKRRANPPAASDTYGRKAAPPPRTFRSVYCARCYEEFRAPEDEHEVKHCGRCQERLRNPRRHAPADAETPRRRGYRSFSCPGKCPVPGCRGNYVPCMVTVDMWQLRCTSCRHEPGRPPICRDDLFDMSMSSWQRQPNVDPVEEPPQQNTSSMRHARSTFSRSKV